MKKHQLKIFIILAICFSAYISYSILYSEKSKAISWVKENGGTIKYEAISWLPTSLKRPFGKPVHVYMNSNKLINNNFELVSKLTSLKDLISFQAVNSQLENIKGIEALTQIEALFLSKNNISDLSHLKNLSNLAVLDIRDNPVDNLTDLKQLKNLHSLLLDNTKITSLEVLSELNNLEYVTIPNTSIKVLKPLDNLPKLRQLNIKGCNIPKEELARFKKVHPNCFIVESTDFNSKKF